SPAPSHPASAAAICEPTAMPSAIARLTSPTPPSKQTGFRERGRSSKHRCSIACQVWRLRSGGVRGRHSATRVPSPRVEREFTVRELCAADVAHAVLLLVRQRAQVLARGANAEHERVPEIIEAVVLPAGAERTTAHGAPEQPEHRQSATRDIPHARGDGPTRTSDPPHLPHA